VIDAAINPWETARQWGGPAALLALAGWLGRQAISWRKRANDLAKIRGLESKSVRYLLDAQRHALRMLTPGDGSTLVDLDEIIRQKALIDDVREELWVADGHKSQRETDAAVAEILKVMTRTQAIQAKDLEMPKGRGNG
jgi:hypothetical protein